jgi:hypothetical protein
MGDYDGVAATGPGDVFADPLFLDGGTGDYALQALSPAIDAGENTPPGGLGAGTDFEGAQRVQDGDGDAFAQVDLGAFEVFEVPEPAKGIGSAAVLGQLGVLARRRKRGRRQPTT